MAGFATRPSLAGHTGRSAKTNHELTCTPDHQMGAGHTVKMTRLNTAGIGYLLSGLSAWISVSCSKSPCRFAVTTAIL
jgi:hypothetical protein